MRDLRPVQRAGLLFTPERHATQRRQKKSRGLYSAHGLKTKKYQSTGRHSTPPEIKIKIKALP